MNLPLLINFPILLFVLLDLAVLAIGVYLAYRCGFNAAVSQAQAVDQILLNALLKLQQNQNRSIVQLETYQHAAAIIESADDAIVSTNLEGYITSWNQGAEKLYGYTEAEALGQSLTSLVVLPSLTNGLTCPVIQKEKAVEVLLYRHETQHRCKDGKVIDISLSMSPIRNATNRVMGAAIIARDISDRRSVERVKDELISVVNHELRTPLTSLRGALGLLVTGKLGMLSAKGQQMLQIATSNTERLVQLINDMLDLEGIASGKIDLHKQTCNIVDLVQQAIAQVQPQAEKKKIHLLVKVAPMSLHADADRLVQTISHLLSNAIKFSAPESTVWITTELQIDSTNASPPRLLMQVKDQGQGIPPERLHHIFERFYQLDASDRRRQGGTGIGLALCQSIVQQHDGKLWAESVLGEGSTFLMSLPLLVSNFTINNLSTTVPFLTNSFLSPLSPTPASKLKGRVLVVEDDLDLIQVLVAGFSDHQIQTLCARTSQEAIVFCQSFLPDLLLLDLTLAQGSGLSVVDWLKKQPKLTPIPIVIYTAKDLDDRERHQLQWGQTTFFTKSRVSPEVLQGHVVHLLEQAVAKRGQGCSL